LLVFVPQSMFLGLISVASTSGATVHDSVVGCGVDSFSVLI
jgi:hypothetical protein